jgi:transposase
VEYDRVYDWEDRAGRSDHVGAALAALKKAAILQETYSSGISVSLVSRRHRTVPNQLFTWRWLHASGALSAIGAGEEMVAASEYRALQQQVRELQRLLGKKTLENEIVREALDLAQPKTAVARALADAGRHAVKTIANTLGVARARTSRPRGPLSQVAAVGGRRGKRLSCTSQRVLHAVQMLCSLELTPLLSGLVGFGLSY